MFTSYLILSLAAAAAEGAPPADLASILRDAEAGNPEIAAARGRLAAAGTLPSQMEAPPDPVAGVSYSNVGYAGPTLGDDGDSMLTLSWSQEVPYPGKLRLAGEAARREMEMSRSRLEQVRLDVLARVKEAFAELYHSDSTSRILMENRLMLASFLDTARVRYETGEGLLQNVLKAQTEISKLDAELARYTEQRRVAEARLSTLTGRSEVIPLGPVLDLPEMTASPDPALLEKDALSRSPEILEARAAVARDEARLDLARRQLKPDFIWGAAYAYRGDIDPQITGAVGVRLPLYRERKQAQMIAMAEGLLEAARKDLEAKRLVVVAQVRELAARLARTETLETLYTEAIIPQAHSSLDSAAASYGVGRVDFLTLISDFGTVLGYERDYVTQHRERFLALAALERLTARALIDAGPGAPSPEEASP
jgi:outer membrane protein TolC